MPGHDKKNASKISIEPENYPYNQLILRKNEIIGIRLSNFKLYYRTIEIKVAWYQNKDRSQMINGIEYKPRGQPPPIWAVNL